MKLFTQVLIALAGWLVALQASATTFTVLVGQNGDNYDPVTTRIVVGDQVRFQWVSGLHPTESDDTPQAWATFTPSASNAVVTLPAFTRPGTYNYHCTVHAFQSGGQWIGMKGVIIVTPRPTAVGTAATAPVLNLFPNPTRGQATLQFAAKSGQDYKLRISNLIGREVRTLALKPEMGADGLPIDLNGLPAGMYFYSLLVNDKVVSTKRLTLQQ